MNVTGTIGGNSITGYVRSLHRTQQLCNPTAVATLILSTNFPGSTDPAEQVVLYEEGVKVFTGYVVKSTRERPSYDWNLEIHDVYTKCVNFFIDAPLTIGHDPVTDQPLSHYVPQSTDYWIGYLCGLVGLSFTSSGGHGTVPQGVQIGLRTVHESLTDIIAYSSQYVRANADGELRFERVNRDRIDFMLNECIDVDDTLSDEWTRNVVKVFGYSSVDNRVLSVASVEIPGIVPDRITAVGAPMIGTQSEADRVSSYLLDELGHLTHIVSAKVEGNPNIHIGKAAHIVHDTTDYTDAVTTVIHNTDERTGYTTEVTIGERCPRISGWSRTTPMIYAGTTRDGVYVSTNGGADWAAFNTGLPTGDKFVRCIGANSYNEAMAIVNAALYYTDGQAAWSSRTLPVPPNDAGDDPAPTHAGTLVAVDALGSRGSFAALTTWLSSTGSGPTTEGHSRSWVHECQSTGSTPGSWTTTQLVTTGPDVPADPYNVIGLDLKTTLGVPYALGGSRRAWVAIPGDNFGVKRLSDKYAQTYIQGFSYTCNTGEGPRFEWWAQDIISQPNDIVLVNLYSYVYLTSFRDNVFLYGSYSNKTQVAGQDNSGYYRWPVQSFFSWYPGNVLGIPPYLWVTSMRFYVGTSGSLPPDTFDARYGQTLYFSLFWSPYPRSTNFLSLAQGEQCGPSYAPGISPYGDAHGPFGGGGPLNPATPFPITSSFAAGSIGAL